MLASVSQLISPTTALAAGACGVQGSYQIGFASVPGYPQPYAYRGAMATITDAGGYRLCTGVGYPYNFAVAWVMLFSNDGNGYAQSGTVYNSAQSPDCVRIFSEQQLNQATGFGSDVLYGGCVAPGSINTFWVQSLMLGGQLRVRSNVGTVPIQTSYFSPDLWHTPLQIAYNTEAAFPETNVPGTAADPEDYADLKVQLSDLSYQGACYHVQLYNSVGPSGSASYHSAKFSCSETETWGN